MTKGIYLNPILYYSKYMKNIGIVGGLSPESTIIYYKHIIQCYYEKFKDYNFPEIIIYSVSFQKYVEWGSKDKLDIITNDLNNAVNALKRAGADFGIIAANTPHLVFDEVSKNTKLPLISIIDATAEEIQKENFKTIGLLGTIFTMSKDFYKNGLLKYDIKTIVPKKEDQEFISRVIYRELTRGKIKSESKRKFLEIIEKLKKEGTEGVILGCTEIPLLISQEDCEIKLFNTAIIHAEKALNYALGR